ncbi:MAG: TetR family transcriptional regulator, partial [Deltaproteobacteria bacterium]
MTEVKRQPRGEAKREQVLDATIRLVAREGPGAVTLRAVAAEAGTSLRGATYYFASRDELLTEAFLHYTRRAIQRFEAIAAQAPPPGKGSRAVAAAMLADTVLIDVLGDRPGLVAEYELVL